MSKDWETSWQAFWLPLLKTKGKLDIKKVKKEIHDFDFIIKQLPKVYDHITSGKLSKHMYSAETVIAAHDDICHEYCVNKDDARQREKELKNRFIKVTNDLLVEDRKLSIDQIDDLLVNILKELSDE